MTSIYYPKDKMLKVSKEVDQSAIDGLSAHTRGVQELLSFVDALPPIIRDRLVPAIDHWDKQVQQQYGTYREVATRLYVAGTDMDEQDALIAQGFKTN